MVRRRALFIAAWLFAGCLHDRHPLYPDSPSGRWYVVAEGETLADIARRAGVPPSDLLEINGLERAEQVTPGILLFVLDGQSAMDGVTPAPADVDLPATSPSPTPPAVGQERLRWPMEKTHIGSPFGTRAGRPHEGIDLPAPVGTPVFAAAAGRVVYAGNGIRGYGKLIVLQHSGDLLTVYAHNSVLLVVQGAYVQAGQKVALVGQTGHATGPHLHFEVRQGQIPRDPMRFFGAIPARQATGGMP